MSSCLWSSICRGRHDGYRFTATVHSWVLDTVLCHQYKVEKGSAWFLDIVLCNQKGLERFFPVLDIVFCNQQKDEKIHPRCWVLFYVINTKMRKVHFRMVDSVHAIKTQTRKVFSSVLAMFLGNPHKDEKVFRVLGIILCNQHKFKECSNGCQSFRELHYRCSNSDTVVFLCCIWSNFIKNQHFTYWKRGEMMWQDLQSQLVALFSTTIALHLVPQ